MNISSQKWNQGCWNFFDNFLSETTLGHEVAVQWLPSRTDASKNKGDKTPVGPRSFKRKIKTTEQCHARKGN